jgi:hypothetical protein
MVVGEELFVGWQGLAFYARHFARTQYVAGASVRSKVEVVADGNPTVTHCREGQMDMMCVRFFREGS